MDQNKAFPQGEETYPKGGEMSSESSHEGDVTRKEEDQRGIMVLGGGRAIIGRW